MTAAPVQAREELSKVASLVLTARRLLASGTLVDLSAIEDRVRVVVDTVEAMPAEDGRELLDDMTTLIDKLDRLSQELQEQLVQFDDTRS
ncbi:MAG TPA: hypothetical protein VK558_11300 [Patescibacteria group bacterium]|nr:hypothetical protein [Patescibacteria group bacterium]